jgi:hypothetical protein
VSSVMSEYRPTEVDGEATPCPWPKRSIRPIGVLLAVNSLSLPGFLLAIYFVDDTSANAIVNYLQFFFGHALETQIFLLAFWLSLGGVPRRWRALSAFVIAMFLGFGLGIGIVSIAVLKNEEPLDPDYPLGAMIVMIPIFVLAALWVINAVYVIPAWFFGMEIAVPGNKPMLATRSRTFGIAQLFSWTAQAALPLGLLNVMMVLDNGNDAATYWSLAPFVAVLLCCTPLLIVLLTPRLSIVLIFLTLVWTGLIAASISILPSSWEASVHLNSAPLLVNVVVVVANCIALRWMKLRWCPRSVTEPLPNV